MPSPSSASVCGASGGTVEGGHKSLWSGGGGSSTQQSESSSLISSLALLCCRTQREVLTPFCFGCAPSHAWTWCLEPPYCALYLLTCCAGHYPSSRHAYLSVSLRQNLQNTRAEAL